MTTTHQKLLHAGSWSVTLRVAAFACKLMFVVGLARFSTPEVIGAYSLLAALAVVFIYSAGLELHVHVARVIAGKHSDVQAAYALQQVQWVLMLAALALPFVWLWLNYFSGGLNIQMMGLVAVLLLEVLCQELGRYLLLVSRPILSTTFQLIRSALWMPVALLILMSGVDKPVNVIIYCWIGGLLVAILCGASGIRTWKFEYRRLSLSWFAHAFSQARFYFVATLFTQVIGFSDRFIIQHFLGDHKLGIYAFYLTLANAIQAIVQTGVVGILTPDLIVAGRNKNVAEVSRIQRQMKRSGLFLGVGMSVVLAIAMPTILRLLGKESYSSIEWLFPWMLMSNLVFVAVQVPQLVLYAYGKDRILMWLCILGGVVTGVGNIAAVFWWGLPGAVAASLASGLVLFSASHSLAVLELQKQSVGVQ